MAWFVAFVLTVLIEVPIVVALAPRGLRRRAALDAFAVNLCTHPLAWVLLATASPPWALIEVSVAMAELLVYRSVTRLSWARAAAAALTANATTAALSLAF